jgi:nucleosome binding factor SPN SPT16 subunit
MARTLFIDPTQVKILFFASTKFLSELKKKYLKKKEQKVNYLAILELQNLVVSNLRNGNKLKNVYENALNTFKEKHPQLLDKICKNFGAGVDLQIL